MRADIRHLARHFLLSRGISKQEYLSDRNLHTQQNHCTMRVHCHCTGFLRDLLLVGSVGQNEHSNFQQHPLTSALSIISTT